MLKLFFSFTYYENIFTSVDIFLFSGVWYNATHGIRTIIGNRARIWANYETGYGGATRCIVYRHLFESRLGYTLPRISPFARFTGITYSIPIYDIPELAELRGDSYYHRIGFARIEQVLTHVDEKIPTIVLVPIEERVLLWWGSLVNRGIRQWRTGSVRVSIFIFFFFIRICYFVCSVRDFLSGVITSLNWTGL